MSFVALAHLFLFKAPLNGQYHRFAAPEGCWTSCPGPTSKVGLSRLGAKELLRVDVQHAASRNQLAAGCRKVIRCDQHAWMHPGSKSLHPHPPKGPHHPSSLRPLHEVAFGLHLDESTLQGHLVEGRAASHGFTMEPRGFGGQRA